MAANSKIEWCDHTASPWHGCTKVAAGCTNCYAAAMAPRNHGTLGIWGDHGTRIKSKSFGDNLRKWNRQAEKTGRVASVFPSICDPFEDRPELVPWRNEMFAAADLLPLIRLLLLTKRPQNIRGMWPCYTTPPHKQYRDNVWLGSSASTQADLEANLTEMAGVRDLAPVRFLSLEPLLEPLSFALRTDGTGSALTAAGINWVILGGESGPKARPCDVEWIRKIVAHCNAAGVPCFVKQLGANVITRNDMIEDVFNNGHAGWPDPEIQHHIHGFRDPKGGDMNEWPKDLRVREFPCGT